MHYYQRNLGDYARDTGHLSALEHGVYTLLLDWYYVNERPITMREAIRVSRGNPEETQVVLSEFFKETELGWIHSYADRVIEEYHVKAARNRENGAKGGRPKVLQPIDSAGSKTHSVSSGMPDLTLTKNQEPLTNNQKIKSAVQPAAARSRFDEFWAAYPNKKGRQDAEKRWKREALDAMADQILDHVRLMQSEDDGWRRGFVPMGSTYLNQARWTDVPQEAPRERSQQAAPSKGMQAIMNLQASKNERVDANGDRNGIPAAHLPWARQTAGNGSDGRNGVGLDVRANAQPRLGASTGCATFPKIVLDHDG